MSSRVRIDKVNNFYSFRNNPKNLQDYDLSEYDSCKTNLNLRKINNKSISRKLKKITKKINKQWKEDYSSSFDTSEDVDNYDCYQE